MDRIRPPSSHSWLTLDWRDFPGYRLRTLLWGGGAQVAAAWKSEEMTGGTYSNPVANTALRTLKHGNWVADEVRHGGVLIPCGSVLVLLSLGCSM